MNNILITLKKELKSFFRDKKTLASLFIYPILIPVMIILYGVIYEGIESEETTYTIGVNYTLNEIDKTIFNSLNMKVEERATKEELEKLYDDNEIDAYLTKEENKYIIYASSSSTNGMMAHEILVSYLDTLKQSLTDEYLVNKGIDLKEAYEHFTYEEVDLGENNYAVTIVFSICFTYVILAIAISASNVAVASTALEKENGTLETILTFPISTRELITGKYLAAVTLGFISSFVSIILLVFGLMYGSANYAIYSDYTFTFNAGTLLGGVVISLITSFFIAGVAFFLTAKAKSFKEAQGKIGFINTLCIIPMFVDLMGITIDAKYYLIPICNSVKLLNDLFTNSLIGTNLIICMVSNVAYGLIIIYLVSKTYNNEKVLFSN